MSLLSPVASSGSATTDGKAADAAALRLASVVKSHLR
jgi:hypothetical protein